MVVQVQKIPLILNHHPVRSIQRMLRDIFLDVASTPPGQEGRCRGSPQLRKPKSFCLHCGLLTTKFLVTLEEHPLKPRKVGLTDQELEIMKVIWARGNATVREVYEELLKHRKIAYTTVLTMMGVLEQKGRLTKDAGDRAYVYHPSEPRAEVVGSMVTDFIKRVFNGSATPLLVHLAESREIRQEHLDEISKLLKTKRGRK